MVFLLPNFITNMPKHNYQCDLVYDAEIGKNKYRLRLIHQPFCNSAINDAVNDIEQQQ